MNLQTNCEQQTNPGFNQMVGITTEAGCKGYTPFSGIGSGVVPNWEAPIQFPLQPAAPALLGKGWVSLYYFLHQQMNLV